MSKDKKAGQRATRQHQPTKIIVERHMVLLAFTRNNRQYYVPRGTSQKISEVIKHNVEYICEEDDIEDKIYYIWNQSEYKFKKK